LGLSQLGLVVPARRARHYRYARSSEAARQVSERVCVGPAWRGSAGEGGRPGSTGASGPVLPAVSGRYHRFRYRPWYRRRAQRYWKLGPISGSVGGGAGLGSAVVPAQLGRYYRPTKTPLFFI
jgi:hypothetical protein